MAAWAPLTISTFAMVLSFPCVFASFDSFSQHLGRGPRRSIHRPPVGTPIVGPGYPVHHSPISSSTLPLMLWGTSSRVMAPRSMRRMYALAIASIYAPIIS